jgi:hypothetical protein
VSAIRGKAAHPNSDNSAAATAASPMYATTRPAVVTPVVIRDVQGWLTQRFGLRVALVIERCGDRNRVALRLIDPSCTYEAEVALLNALRKREPRAPMERVMVLFERTA